MSDVQDTDLLDRITKGDDGAWEEFYREHKPIVHSWCWRMTHNFSDADDLTQEVFLRTFLRLSTFRGQAKLRSWLYRVTVNCVLMSRRRRRWREVPWEGVIPTEDGSFTVLPEPREFTSVPSIESLMLQEVIERLPAEKRTVFLLHDILGFSHSEIGQKLRLTMANSKCRLRRARLKLQDDLA